MKHATITSSNIFGKTDDLQNLGKKNSDSFGSTDSFKSFGSMDEKDEVLIMNPCDYTISEG